MRGTSGQIRQKERRDLAISRFTNQGFVLSYID